MSGSPLRPWEVYCTTNNATTRPSAGLPRFGNRATHLIQAAKSKIIGSKRTSGEIKILCMLGADHVRQEKLFSLSLSLSTPTSFEYGPLLPGATNASSSILLLCDIFGYGVIPAGPVHNDHSAVSEHRRCGKTRVLHVNTEPGCLTNSLCQSPSCHSCKRSSHCWGPP
jgi:hypothetical protein